MAAHIVQSRSRALRSGAESTSDAGIVQELNRYQELQKLVAAVRLGADKCRARKLVVAASQFHEDRILVALMNALLNEVGIRFTVHQRKWGSLQTKDGAEADFGVVAIGNRLRVPTSRRHLYSFKGYYAFARRDWLEDLLKGNSGQLPSKLVKYLPKILEQVDPLKSCSAEEVNVRAWLAVSGGVCRNNANGFDELTEPLKRRAKRMGRLLAPPPAQGGPPMMDDEFEHFLRGRVFAFMGGALHSRLIRRWWATRTTDQPICELLNPTLISSVLRPVWPRWNVLEFSDNCFAGAEKRDRLKTAIELLYRGVGTVLCFLAQTPVDRARDVPLLSYLTASLIANKYGDNDSRWSFVTEEEDLALLLHEDNGGWCTSA